MMRVLRVLLLLVIVAVVAIYCLRLIFPLPDISQRPEQTAIPADGNSPLGRLMDDAMRQHPGKSGVIPLGDGHDALASRLALADAAQSSIDTQYYIWHDDTSGIMLLDALRRAAQRGVRVRLLLDDNGVPGLDGFMAALNAQDNFEVRLFNPSTVRRPKILGYAFDFMRMNRRMHNKSFVVDGAAAIIGGRNIGNEYFQLGSLFYVDMDALATGAIVPETARVFDEYWNSASVFAVDQIISGRGDIDALMARVAEVEASDEADELRGYLASSAARFAQGAAQIEWTDVQLVADDPVKGQGLATRDQLMITRLAQIMGQVERRLYLVSAYFVPGKQGTAYFDDLARAGKDVRILTNALNTTDVLLVHSGYTKYRRELLEAGVHLYELKLRAGEAPGSENQLKPLGLSGASLHAKTFAVDDARVFIGSFNFDPRSAMLNCEMGFLIDSPTMATRISRGFDGALKNISYTPELTPENKIIWKEDFPDGRVVTYQEEPGATWLQQITLVIIGLLPIEWLL